MLTNSQENLIRACTRYYMDNTNDYPKSWAERKHVVSANPLVKRLVENKCGTYDSYEVKVYVGNIIVDEWRNYE